MCLHAHGSLFTGWTILALLAKDSDEDDEDGWYAENLRLALQSCIKAINATNTCKPVINIRFLLLSYIEFPLCKIRVCCEDVLL